MRRFEIPLKHFARLRVILREQVPPEGQAAPWCAATIVQDGCESPVAVLGAGLVRIQPEADPRSYSLWIGGVGVTIDADKLRPLQAFLARQGL